MNNIKLPGAYGRNFGSRGKLQDLNGICDTLIAAMGMGGGNVPIIQEVKMDNEINKTNIALKRGYSVSVTDEKNDVGDKIDVLGNYSKSNYMATQIVNKNGICPTVRENHGQLTGVVVEDKNTNESATIIREEPLERDGWHRNAKEVLNVDGLCRTISTQSNNLVTKIKEKPSLRIRKLTPTECFRLQGFDDEDLNRAKWGKVRTWIEGGSKKASNKFKIVKNKDKINESFTYVSKEVTEDEYNKLQNELVYETDFMDVDMRIESISMSTCLNLLLKYKKEFNVESFMGLDIMFLAEDKSSEQFKYIIIKPDELDYNKSKCYLLSVNSKEANDIKYQMLYLTSMLLDSKVLNPQVNEVCVSGSGKFQYFEDKKTIEFVIGTIQVDSIKEVMSNSALYKQAGNSICVPVVQYILKELFDCGVLSDETHILNS